jgi:phage tail sheath protein FI
MPEYLAPGVYVEEVDTGSKPIEGVSTSTAGMIGVTERGPLDVPILVTSFGEFRRWFGDHLDFTAFSNGPLDRHCYVPNAVQGFFENGGKRVYVVRVLDRQQAQLATGSLFDAGDAGSASTVILRAAPEQSGTAANQPLLIVLDGQALLADDWVRVGDGSAADYHQVDVAPVADTSLVSVHLPLHRSHAPATAVREFNPNIAANRLGLAVATTSPVEAGASQITIEGVTAHVTAIANGILIEIGNGQSVEYRYVVADPANVQQVTPTDSQATVTLDSPLAMPYDAATPVQRLNGNPAAVAAASIDTRSNGGDALMFVDNTAGAFNNRTHAVMTLDGAPEVRRIGIFAVLPLDVPVYDRYPAGSIVEEVTLADDQRPAAVTVAGDQTLTIAVAGLVIGQSIVIDSALAIRETAVIAAIDEAAGTVTLVSPLANAHAAGAPVMPAAKSTTAPALAGASFLTLDNRVGLAAGMVVRVGPAGGGEFVTVADIPSRGPAGVSPDAGNVRIQPALAVAYPVGAPVTIQAAPTVTATAPAVVILQPAAGQTTLHVSDGSTYVTSNVVRVTTGAGAATFHRLAANAVVPAPDAVTLRTALRRTHPAGSAVAEREPLIDVQALDPGAWGNRLRVSVQDEIPGVVAPTDLQPLGTPQQVRLASVSNVEPGTVLEVRHPQTGLPIDPLLKVENLNRATREVRLAAPGLDPVQLAVAATLPPGLSLRVGSRDFQLTVQLVRTPDPAVPSRDESVVAEEVFRHLSMDPRHSRYVQAVVGDIQGPRRLSDRRPEGESWYVRVHDRAQDLLPAAASEAELFSIRVGPEALIDVLPDGRVRPARHRLELVIGDDSIATLTDAIYRGFDDPTPENRTGLQSLRNIDEISIVAAPGRTSVEMQGELISHCELLRYRFAVLDAQTPPADTLTDVQVQRQQFDSKYAAIYHPWLTIPDPLPVPNGREPGYPVPPSGHVLGVFARTDIERGVHKAPANEIVRGILGLQRLLTKEQQDILNPSPVNINVIRDFRDNNRGIRVFGGRVVTSDPDWKYVNVRRLLIFIEASIDRGLQWVVFEPNAEPLWARVQRSISNFLTTVWRNGALEGVRPEEAYFVKCDRTTMTQTDIDNGRLIVLVGVAPVKPAEFVIIRIGLWTARAD